MLIIECDNSHKQSLIFLFNLPLCCTDLAVGAPFYDKGAVFIYNGKGDGTLVMTPSQVCRLICIINLN